jgi:putative NADPH-quinone reductase
MKALILYANPDSDSYSADLKASARKGLLAAGHDVSEIDLYAMNFQAAMSPEERLRYHDADPIVDHQIQEQADLVAASQIIVFVYPTWWFGMPAVLKGWFDRVMIPTVAFDINPDTKLIESKLRHVRRLVGVTTTGSHKWQSFLIADTGRWLICRAMRLLSHPNARSTWLHFDRVDQRSFRQREMFLKKVEIKLSRL